MSKKRELSEEQAKEIIRSANRNSRRIRNNEVVPRVERRADRGGTAFSIRVVENEKGWRHMKEYDRLERAGRLIDGAMKFFAEAFLTLVILFLAFCIGGVLMTLHYKHNVTYQCLPAEEAPAATDNDVPATVAGERCFYVVPE